MLDKIEEVLNVIRPTLERDGGGIEVVEFNEPDGVLKVKFQGACVGCPMSTVTLKMVVESVLKEEIPTIKQVVAV
jgi:Fe-S cluster biogenesis protein NfuA